jgi:hypothetical protein
MSEARVAGLAPGLHPAVRAVVLEALTRGVGANLSTNVDFKARYNIGAGTMQRALELLRDRGAVTILNRGHLGRRIEHVDIGQAWQAAGLAPVRMILPPSGPIEIDVLTERLADELTRLGVPHTVHHLRGGANRLSAVHKETHDLAVVSAGTWSERKTPTPTGLDVVRVLDPGTYYAPGRLVVVTRTRDQDKPIRRVAIDRQSSDHVALTRAEFPESDGYEYVDAPFPSVPAWVLRERVDAGIWHETVSVVPLDIAGIDINELQRPAAATARDELSGATLVGSPARPELRMVVQALGLSTIRAHQQKALLSAHDDSLI